MKTFKSFLKVILIQEGGSKYTDDPDDPGGATKYGISLRFLKDLPKDIADINKDGKIDKEDIKNLTEEQAAKIYYEYFWKPMNLDSINNDLLKLHLFSHGVHAGTKTAIKLLQRLLGLKEDGILGSVTAIKANSYKNQPELVQMYANARKVYFDQIIKIKPSLEKYRKGWYNRVDKTYFYD